MNSGSPVPELPLWTAVQSSLPTFPRPCPADGSPQLRRQQQLPCVAKGRSESLPASPAAARPHLPGPLVQKLRYPAPLCLGAAHHFLSLIMFCFVLFSFTLFPGRLSKATFCRQGTQKGQGLSGHLGFPKPQLPPGWGWGGLLCYLFIYLVLLSSTPPKLSFPTGEDEKRPQTMGDKACHMAPSV